MKLVNYAQGSKVEQYSSLGSLEFVNYASDKEWLRFELDIPSSYSIDSEIVEMDIHPFHLEDDVDLAKKLYEKIMGEPLVFPSEPVESVDEE